MFGGTRADSLRADFARQAILFEILLKPRCSPPVQRHVVRIGKHREGITGGIVIPRQVQINAVMVDECMRPSLAAGPGVCKEARQAWHVELRSKEADRHRVLFCEADESEALIKASLCERHIRDSGAAATSTRDRSKRRCAIDHRAVAAQRGIREGAHLSCEHFHLGTGDALGVLIGRKELPRRRVADKLVVRTPASCTGVPEEGEEAPAILFEVAPRDPCVLDACQPPYR